MPQETHGRIAQVVCPFRTKSQTFSDSVCLLRIYRSCTIRIGSSPPPRQPFQPSAKTTQSTHENHPAKAALQNGPFRVAIRPISQAKTAHFALRNGPFCNVLIISVLHTRIYFFLMTLSTCEAKLLIPFTDGCPLFLSMSLRRITGTP